MRRLPTGRSGSSLWPPGAGLIRPAAVCALLPLLGGCAGLFEAPQPAATKLVLASRASDGEAAAAMISRYRAARGLSPVSADATLTEAAEAQARVVAAAGSLSHGDFPSRMASFGIKGVAAENLSAGRVSVAEVIAGWKASKGHNENLLLDGLHRIGIARIDTPGVGYGEYWALVLSQ